MEAQQQLRLYQSLTAYRTQNREPLAPLDQGATSFLRRAHSDGLPANAAAPSEGETWTEFLRETAGAAYITNGLREASNIQPRGEASRNANASVHTGQRNGLAEAAGHKRNSSASDDEVNKRSNPALGPSISGSSSNPIDLTSSLDAQQSVRLAPRPIPRRQSSLTLPPWQPDEDVLNCPVCGITFNWYNRKHHCRRCGKVICAQCSQHRITIPREFIVQPPQAFDQLLDRAASPPRAHASALGGGEVVRVCNPCVPDPNLSPPPTLPQYGDTASSRLLESSRRRKPQIPARTTSATFQGSVPPPYPANDRAGTTTNILPAGRHQWRLAQSASADEASPAPPPAAARRSSARDDPPFLVEHADGTHPQGAVRRSTISMGNSSSNAGQARPIRQRSTRRAANPYDSHGLADGPPSLPAIPTDPPGLLGSLNFSASTPRPSLIRRSSSEFCPICSKAFDKLGVDRQDDAAKATHVDSCIHSTSTTFRGSVDQDDVVGASMDSNRRRTPHHPSDATTSTRTSSSNNTLGGRMLRYRAVEKDCVQSDGSVKECVICMEDFEPGAELGRLDCFCQFHAKCIRDWWASRRAAGYWGGECPTHKVSRGI